MRPQPAVECRVGQADGDLFNYPQALAWGVNLRSEPAEEVVLRKKPGEFPGHLELARARQAGDHRRAVALPGQRVVGGVSRRRPLIQKAHHQVGDLRIQTVGESLVRQVQLYRRAHDGAVRRAPLAGRLIVNPKPGGAVRCQFNPGIAPAIGSLPLRNRGPLGLPAGIALVAHPYGHGSGLDGQGPAVVDGQSLFLPGYLPYRTAGGADATDCQLEAVCGIAAMLKLKSRVPQGAAGPSRLIMGRRGDYGRSVLGVWPGEPLANLLERNAVARRFQVASGATHPIETPKLPAAGLKLPPGSW